MLSIEPVGDVKADHGEGPYWDESAASLCWVDIPAGLLYRTEPDNGRTVATHVGAPLAAVLPAQGGGMLVARGLELILLGADGQARVVAQAPGTAGCRFNDGSVDASGRVWMGTMDTAEQNPIGGLYRLEPDGSLTTHIGEVTVSNGIGWSPDGKRMYYTDSPTRRVDVIDYDDAYGTLGDRRPFADLSGANGVPDGLTVDADGYVWVAVHGGGVLHRYAPSGELDAVLELPVTHPTSCAFGGADLGDLYITTSRQPLTEHERRDQPLAGRLLRMAAQVPGQRAASTGARVLRHQRGDLLGYAHPPGVDHQFAHLAVVDRVEPDMDPPVAHVALARHEELARFRGDGCLPQFLGESAAHPRLVGTEGDEHDLPHAEPDAVPDQHLVGAR